MHRPPAILPARLATGRLQPRADAVGPGLVSPAAARSGAAMLLALVLLGFGPGDLERGNRMYRDGRYAEAVEAYRSALQGGRTSPELHYNLGTALLALGEYGEAEQHLQAALQAVDPELRHRTYYNLGNRFLEEGRAQPDPQAQGRLLDAAIEAYRRSLRIAPATRRPSGTWSWRCGSGTRTASTRRRPSNLTRSRVMTARAATSRSRSRAALVAPAGARRRLGAARTSRRAATSSP
jgi:tetratricopeptide (TPR) repeat protein